MIIRNFYHLQIIPLLFILSCGTSELQNVSLKEYPVTFIVSNQNGLGIDPIHVTVKITEHSRRRDLPDSSNTTIVDQDFYWKTGHSFPSFNLNLKKASYRILAEGKNITNKLDVIFEVDRPIWILVSFGKDDQFRLHISYSKLIFG